VNLLIIFVIDSLASCICQEPGRPSLLLRDWSIREELTFSLRVTIDPIRLECRNLDILIKEITSELEALYQTLCKASRIRTCETPNIPSNKVVDLVDLNKLRRLKQTKGKPITRETTNKVLTGQASKIKRCHAAFVGCVCDVLRLVESHAEEKVNAELTWLKNENKSLT